MIPVTHKISSYIDSKCCNLCREERTPRSRALPSASHTTNGVIHTIHGYLSIRHRQKTDEEHLFPLRKANFKFYVCPIPYVFCRDRRSSGFGAARALPEGLSLISSKYASCHSVKPPLELALALNSWRTSTSAAFISECLYFVCLLLISSLLPLEVQGPPPRAGPAQLEGALRHGDAQAGDAAAAGAAGVGA